MDNAEVVRTYRDLLSIKSAARKLNLSEQTVRRILLAEGEYTSPRAQEIDSMVEAGLTIDEISTELGVSQSAVHSYLPYSKGSYAVGEKSKNALRIIKMRKRRKFPT